MTIRMDCALLMILLPACSIGQTAVTESARQGIAAGNNAWIEGMKRGEARLISATYAEDALDCNAAGECAKGRAAIEHSLQDRISRLGRALSASVTSKGSVQEGDFVYEWGEAEAAFANGNRIVGKYLTVWRRQGARGWEIFRNMRIPADENR